MNISVILSQCPVATTLAEKMKQCLPLQKGLLEVLAAGHSVEGHAVNISGIAGSAAFVLITQLYHCSAVCPRTIHK